MDPLLEQQVPRLIELLASQSWVEVPGAVSPEVCAALQGVLDERYEKGRFRPARIGHGLSEMQCEDIRSDTIQWIEADDPGEGVQDWLKEMDSLRQLLNEAFFLSTQTYDCHFSCYEIGASYKKHHDRFRGGSTRVLSVILFLNPAWANENEGQLLIYDPNAEQRLVATINPEQGTLVIFESDKVPHEVRATKRRRLSLTGWFTRH